MRFITVKWLRKRGACCDGIKIFMDEFGEIASIKQVIDKLRQIKKPEWEGWLMAQELKMTKAMLKNGADIHACKDFALQLVVADGRFKVAKLLLKNGADIHACKDFALQLAVLDGRFKVAKLLLENGADTHAMDNCVIKSAVENNDLKLVKLLFQKGADIHTGNDYVILWAKAHGYRRIISFLRKAQL